MGPTFFKCFVFLLQHPKRLLSVLIRRCRLTDIPTTRIYPEYLKSMYEAPYRKNVRYD